MELRIYTPDLRRVGQAENQTSVRWRRKFYEPGEFEIHLPITPTNLSLFEKDNLVTYRGAAEAGVISSIEREESDLKDEMTIKGNFLSIYMNRRIIKSTVNFSGKTEKAMFDLYNGCTALPNVTCADLKGFTDTVTFQATYKNLLNIEKKLSAASLIGFRFRPDFANRRIIFETYKGTDHTVEQHTNKRVIFSETYNNLKNVKYDYNNDLLKTYAIVGGEGEGSARKIVTVGGGEGLDLREMFVDAKDLQQGDLTDAQYEAALKQRGIDALNAAAAAETIEPETEPAINFTYKTDYDLGDTVTVKKKNWNLTQSLKITELEEVYEYGAMTVVPTFGSNLPETVNWDED